MPDWGLLRNALNGGDLDGGKRKTRPPRFLHILTCSGLLVGAGDVREMRSHGCGGDQQQAGPRASPLTFAEALTSTRWLTTLSWRHLRPFF